MNNSMAAITQRELDEYFFLIESQISRIKNHADLEDVRKIRLAIVDVEKMIDYLMELDQDLNELEHQIRSRPEGS